MIAPVLQTNRTEARAEREERRGVHGVHSVTVYTDPQVGGRERGGSTSTSRIANQENNHNRLFHL